MSEIKKLLHRYLCEDAIKVCELAEKADDFVWLEKQGYYVRKTGEKTQKGKAYMKKHNEMMCKCQHKNVKKFRNENVVF